MGWFAYNWPVSDEWTCRMSHGCQCEWWLINSTGSTGYEHQFIQSPDGMLWISFQVFTFFPELIVSERVAPLFIYNSNVQLWSRFQWIVEKISVEWVSRWTRIWVDTATGQLVEPVANGINWTLTFFRLCSQMICKTGLGGHWLFIDRSQLSVAKLAAWWWHHLAACWATGMSRSNVERVEWKWIFEMIFSAFWWEMADCCCVSVRRHKEIVNGTQS